MQDTNFPEQVQTQRSNKTHKKKEIKIRANKITNRRQNKHIDRT